MATYAYPLANVPATLKNLPRWVLFDANKVPLQVNGVYASSTSPNTWTTFENVAAALNRGIGVGLGFVVNGDGITGIDLDGCRNPETEEITEWAQRVIDYCNAYTEITPSGMGLRVWVRGTMPSADKVFNLDPKAGFGSKVKIEVYATERYFTVTANSYYGEDELGDVEAVDMVGLYKLHHEIRARYPAPRNESAESADAGEPTKAMWHGNIRCPKYDIFKRGEIVNQSHPFRIDNGIGWLEYPSQSEADLAFCTVLALMHDGDADKVWDEYVESPLVREKWLNRKDDFLRLTVAKAIESAKKVKAQNAATEKLQPTPDLEVRDVQEPEPQPLTLPRSCLASSYLGKLYDEVFAPNDWPLEMALPALVTAACVVIPQPSYDGAGILLRGDMKTSLYTALIAPVHSGKSQVIEWATKSLGIYHDTRDKNYTQVKFGSAEQMWKYLFKHSAMNDQQDPKAFQRAVLVNPDEWSHVMAKAGIPDATLASTLTTAFYNRRHIITLGGQGGGRDITIPFPFSIIGGIVQEDFDSVFDASTLGGLYDRFLFGLAPDGFNWSYRSFPSDHPFLQSTPKPVVTVAHPSLEEVIKDWNKRDRELGRIVEVCARVAAVFAAIDGRTKVVGEDLEKLWPLAQYQKAIRAMYKPNPGMNPDAIYANAALSWTQANAQQWRTLRDLQKGTNYHRRKLGPNVAFRSVQALARDGQIDVWVSTADGGGNLNQMPADYQGKRPKIGAALIRLAKSHD